MAVRGLVLELGGRRLLDGVDLDVPAGQVTGLAGESGSGKTLTGMAVLGLPPQGACLSGSIRYGGRELVGLGARAHNALRGKELAMVFQDPTASLHPMLSIGGQLTDHVRHHLRLSRRQARARALEVLEQVRVPSPEQALRRYPHEFSGGQLQRIAIAIAIACRPRVLVADEPTTALDVTVQAGIMRLLRQLCEELDLAVLLVTHDLAVMSSLADTIAVMRTGAVVEHGPRRDVIRTPQHPYTRSLVEALPDRARRPDGAR
ncbi:ABC transporter ATP-binding protein [Kineococcus sp. SYSU DK006]|uniref:ABC transporter ATP-binding protein n=1 Tax=Kineococcus sp. SYSU DK006 TaxID=3383127 RepID=UPI003D7E821D